MKTENIIQVISTLGIFADLGIIIYIIVL